MKKQNDLSVILANIETAAAAVDDLAKQMLAVIKAAKADTLPAFDAMVSAAYSKNGWSQVAGRPSADSALKPAPDAVKLYISNVRAAYRLNLDVLSFETIGAMRTAIKEKRAEIRAERALVPAEPVPPALVGVQFTDGDELTGATLHDVLVLYSHLPEVSQAKLVEEIRKLTVRFVKAAPEYLRLAA